MVVSGNRDSNCFYSDIFPPLFIHDDNDEENNKKIYQKTKISTNIFLKIHGLYFF